MSIVLSWITIALLVVVLIFLIINAVRDNPNDYIDLHKIAEEQKNKKSDK